jgi:hypothetical protein
MRGMKAAKPEPRRVPLDLRGLGARDEIFRLPAVGKPQAAVEAWLNDEPRPLRSLAAKWFMRMRQCGDDVRELIHDGCPVACVEDAAFAYVNSFKGHVNVGFFYGALLDDPAGLLQGSGKLMRHVQLSPGAKVDESALGELIDAAYQDIQTRLGTE